MTAQNKQFMKTLQKILFQVKVLIFISRCSYFVSYCQTFFTSTLQTLILANNSKTFKWKKYIRNPACNRCAGTHNQHFMKHVYGYLFKLTFTVCGNTITNLYCIKYSCYIGVSKWKIKCKDLLVWLKHLNVLFRSSSHASSILSLQFSRKEM